MIKRVWELDENDFYIGFNDLTEENEDTLNYTTVPMTVGYYKPKFNKETQEWIEGATEEEIEEMKRQEEESRPPQEPSEIEVIKQKVFLLEESQQVQDLLIDDIVFEVIPTLESQIGSQSSTTVLNSKLNLLNKIKGDGQGMAGYLARKIIEGRDYATVFKTNSYKQYQDEVDTILELEGRGDLIKREVAYRG